MPFYDYKCPSCSEIFEIQKGMTENFSPRCPNCKSLLQQIFYAPRIGKSTKDILDSVGSEQSGSCTTCTSGICSRCNAR